MPLMSIKSLSIEVDQTGGQQFMVRIVIRRAGLRNPNGFEMTGPIHADGAHETDD